jgi:hypothetical protein
VLPRVVALGECTMRFLPSLPRLVLFAWLVWLGVLGLTFGMLVLRVWAPHFLPVTLLLAVFLGAGVMLIAGAAWRIIRGPARRRALGYLLLGTVPLAFFTGHVTYGGLRAAFQRNIPLNLPMKMLIPVGESFMDLEARFRYPERAACGSVVMISAPVANGPEQAAAMDRHVHALEERLGRAVNWQIHWVRGPLMGMQGRALVGLCMGSLPGVEPVDTQGLSILDRHEVAHCVIHGHCLLDASPPAWLVEGWAEANSGRSDALLAARAWEAREGGDWLTLRELTGPNWYSRHEWPVYRQGGPLVNYILREFGPERFFTLYTTSREATFEQDCRRLLGVSLDELDTACWADIRRAAEKEGPLIERRLEQLELGPQVDAAAWRAFMKGYFAAAKRLLEPYERVRMATTYEFDATDEHGQVQTFTQHARLVCSDRFRSLWVKTRDGEEVYLAHPARSLAARRQSPGEPWESEHDPAVSSQRLYERILRTIEREHPFRHFSPAALLELSEALGRRADVGSVAVTALERFTENGRHLFRVRFEDRSPTDGFPWRSITYLFGADDLFMLRSFEYAFRDGTLKGEVGYEVRNGIPVLRSAQTSNAGKRTRSRFTVVECDFEPTPEKEFAPEHILDGPVVRKLASPQLPPRESSIWDWYAVPLILGVVNLVGGAGTVLRWHRGR